MAGAGLQIFPEGRIVAGTKPFRHDETGQIVSDHFLPAVTENIAGSLVVFEGLTLVPNGNDPLKDRFQNKGKGLLGLAVRLLSL